MKSLLHRILRGLDVDLVRSHTTLEGHLARLLPSLGVNIVCDVGAHHGEYAHLLREVGYRGRIVSFEPVRATYDLLQVAMRGDRDWRGFNVALGPERSRTSINVARATDLTSFLSPSANGARWFGASGSIARTEVVTVERLDDLFEFCLGNLTAPRLYLKLDTQGFDTQVLLGAKETLRRHVVGMQTEIAAQPLYDGLSPFPENLLPFLALGFESTGLFAVSRDPRDMIAAIEYDLVMRRPS